MKFGYWVLLIVLAFPAMALAQRDSIPRMVEGKFDWQGHKHQIGAPPFQQKDLVMYILHKSGMANMFNYEKDQTWVNDFHFYDLDDNGFLDAVFSGHSKYHKGEYTLLFLGDSLMSFPLKFQEKGYIHQYQVDSKGLEMLFRKDGLGADYLSSIESLYFDFESEKLSRNWKLEFIANEDVSYATGIEAFVLQKPSRLRSAPEVGDEKGMDWDKDGKNDGEGNILAVYPRGTRMVRTFQKIDADDVVWSFVIALDDSAAGHLFSRENRNKCYGAGWVRSDAFRRD